MGLENTFASLCVVVLLTLSRNAYGSGNGEWRELANMHIGRYGHGAAQMGGKIYVAGGHVGSWPPYTETVEVYDPYSNSWSFVQPLSEGMGFAATVAHDGKLYVFGGDTNALTIQDTVWVYDPSHDTWEQRAPMPAPRMRAAAVAVGARIYLIGGCKHGCDYSDTFIYEPALDQWITANPHLGDRVLGDSATAFNGFVHVFGAMLDGTYDFCQRYDTCRGLWFTASPPPTEHGGGAVATVGGRSFLIGGTISGGEHGLNHWYDHLSGSWDMGPPLPVPRFDLQAVELNGDIVVIGGTQTGSEAFTSVDLFRPNRSAGVAPYCSCDKDAPCDNEFGGAGCETGSGCGGLLDARGSVSMSADDLLLDGTRLPASQPILVLLGQAAHPLPFGDGILCVRGGGVSSPRLYIGRSDVHGSLTIGPGLLRMAADYDGFYVHPGATWSFQVVFRDPFGPCGSGFNATNALAATFAP